MGIKLREIIEVIGGGVPGGHKFKAVQTGGPSGGCLPEEMLDIGVSYDALVKVGSIILRQVHSLPRRHRANAHTAHAHLRRPGQHGRPRVAC